MDGMQAIQTALALQSSSVQQELGAAVAKTSMDAQRQEGQLAVQLIQESSVPPPTQSSGNNVNIRA